MLVRAVRWNGSGATLDEWTREPFSLSSSL